MATPDFIKNLRSTAGHQLLYLPGVTAVVFDDAGRVLLGRRSDNGEWSVVGGIPEPGEQPARAAVREVFEETAVECEVERIVLVQTLRPVQYENGDICQFMDVTVACRATGGEARVNDEESLEVGWFPVDALPEMREFSTFRIMQALANEPAWFAPAEDATLGDAGLGVIPQGR
ncbi:NUDIX hydrolase [Streptomyces candidus]|uniref:8-oxo-dGTP pyrophosphatase MutT (NUDIX family) n=1 Tax=Streptomyces candidus TaxID=67283 RepID=A0A7X0HK65_9ACTN|nr:NUDIX domain-containing protein [Streptomyces candidus]MBB6437887.1 8-oxo-dGTP pyrophosphatase MutT (NUDIX family) [Streptomyces candidus]GHH49866.1 NUDIX hydrolase [Streptomyces candidus]